MSDQTADAATKIVPFGAQGRDRRHHSDPLDESAQAILGLLNRAADVARDKCDRAMDAANKLSAQLRTAENRIKQLEEEAGYYRDRTARAEQWLMHISQEIENRFFEGRSVASSGR